MNILGIIPARGGSKTVPKKNIKLLDGKPLIYYSIKEAQKSKMITDLVVSSDSNEVLSISKKYNCNIIIRPKKISNDSTPMWPVAKHALENLEKTYDKIYDYILILQPTTPFRSYRDIDRSLKKLISEKSSSLVSVTRVLDGHPARMYKVRKKSALVKNDMRLVREIVGPDADYTELIEVALKFAKNRVVIKQPRYAEPLNDIKECSHKILGKTIRYDVHMIAKF